MYIVKPYEFKVFVHHLTWEYDVFVSDGKFITLSITKYDNLKNAVNNYSDYELKSRIIKDLNPNKPFYFSGLVFYSEFEEIIDINTIFSCKDKKIDNQPKYFPGRKRKNGNMFRRVRTKRTKTLVDLVDAEYIKVRIKAKRRANKLPSFWDDICISNTRSWKKHRKTQYKL